MTAPEILANLLLRETFRPHAPGLAQSPRSAVDLRAALTRARRFILDEKMSAFMADLSQVPFLQAAIIRRPQIIDALRHGARLPHATTWIEFDGRAFRRNMLALSAAYGHVLHSPDGRRISADATDDIVPRWGWLLEEHPQVPQAVQMQTVFELENGHIGVMPYTLVWQTADNPLPWHAETMPGELALGISGYHSPHMGVIYNGPIPPSRQVPVMHNAEGRPYALAYTTDILLSETSGTLRYALALLATLNDVPAEMTHTAQDRGFVARGAYRKFLDHTVIKLTVPMRTDTRRLARKLIAIARRRAHQVRGHWRLYQRGPGLLCADRDHIWGAPDEHSKERCLNCTAWRTWINEHQRGDATLGFVMHDYAVTHEGEEKCQPQQ